MLRRLRQTLRHRDFRYLWYAESASYVGDNLVIVALALLVSDLSDSPTDLGIVLAAYSAPLVAMLLFGGVWADRLPRHRLMVATDLIRAGLHAVAAVLILSGEVEVWHMAAIGVAFGSAEAFFRPAASGLLPQTVPEAEIQQATALSSVAANGAFFLGPALATALVVTVGVGWAFAVDAATFLFSALMLTRVRPRERGEPGERTTVLGELRAGWHEVRSRTWVWVTIAVFSLGLLVAEAPWFVLGPELAEEHYGETSAFGLLASALGLGLGAGSLLALTWRPTHPIRAGMLLMLLWPWQFTLFGLGVDLEWTLAATAVAGLALGLSEVWWFTALAEHVPPATLSRVTSYDWMGSLALLPLGYALAGPVAEAAGAAEVMIWGSFIALTLMAIGLIPRQTRTLRRTATIDAPPE